MKTLNILFAFIFLFGLEGVNAQSYYNANPPKINSVGLINSGNIETLLIQPGSTTHIYSPDPIQYVDIASNNVEGDIQEDNVNILRIRPDADSFAIGDHFLVTIVTKEYMQTIRLVIASEENKNISHLITIDRNKGLVFDNDQDLKGSEFKKVATMALTKKRKIYNIASYKYGIEMIVNNLYTLGDYIIVDITTKNHSNIQYDINDMRFRLEDVKAFKATVSQELEIKPIYTLYDNTNVVIKRKKSFRNIYVFKKFTYPTQKTFVVELTEREISGRKLQSFINYNQILKADYFM